MTALLAASVLIGMASYRLWRLIGMDQVTEPLRAPLIARSERPGARWWLTLITCAWCLGFWINVAVTIGVGVWQSWGLAELLLVLGAASTVTGVLGRGDG